MKLFVWDFHGVLEKDNEKAVIEISNQVLANNNFAERFSEADNERFYGLKWYEYFEHLLPGLSKADCLNLQAMCFKYAEDNLNILLKYIKPNDHTIEVLNLITSSKNKQIVISNTRQNDLVWFLESIGIKQFFKDEDIIGVNAHQMHKTKTNALKHYLKNTDFSEIVVIGDSESDLIVGREVGATTYFYKHPHREHENTAYANYIINDLREILKELN